MAKNKTKNGPTMASTPSPLTLANQFEALENGALNVSLNRSLPLTPMEQGLECLGQLHDHGEEAKINALTQVAATLGLTHLVKDSSIKDNGHVDNAGRVGSSPGAAVWLGGLIQLTTTAE